MAERSIFRQAALDRLSSPEQLDRVMRVTDPKGWIALSGLAEELKTNEQVRQTYLGEG